MTITEFVDKMKSMKKQIMKESDQAEDTGDYRLYKKAGLGVIWRFVGSKSGKISSVFFETYEL